MKKLRGGAGEQQRKQCSEKLSTLLANVNYLSETANYLGKSNKVTKRSQSLRSCKKAAESKEKASRERFLSEILYELKARREFCGLCFPRHP